LIQTSDGGYALTGHTISSGGVEGGEDFWLIKTDAYGTAVWNRTYGGASLDVAYSVVQTDDGGFALGGETWSFGTGWDNAWLVKTDDNGIIEWNQTYCRSNYSPAFCLAKTSDGGYVLAGRTASERNFGDGDFWIIKTDSFGRMQWDNTYGGPGEETAHSVVQTIDGGYAITGLTNSFGEGGFDTWLVKTDSNGEMEWNHTYGGANDDWATSIGQIGANGYMFSGYTRSFGEGAADFWLVKTDNLGNVEWNETYGGKSEDIAASFAQTTDGGYALAGFTESFGVGSRDFWLIKIGPTEILATVDIDPDTLNLKSNGEWITCYIELSAGFNVGDIDTSTILLNGTIGVDLGAPTQIGDYDCDGMADLMVKFDRSTVIEWLRLADYSQYTGKSLDVNLEITGMAAGTPFEGVDTVKVLLKG